MGERKIVVLPIYVGNKDGMDCRESNKNTYN